MKKKELKNIYKSVDKSVKRVVNHYKYYELADGMVLGIYETPDGVLVRLKQTRDLVPNSDGVFPELKLSGLELLGVTPSSTTQLTLKEHDMKTGEKMSTNWYRHRPVKPEDTKKEETPVLYKEMQKEIIEDLEEEPAETKPETPKETKSSVITTSDLVENILEYEDIMKKGQVIDLDSNILISNPEHILLNATVSTAASKIVQDGIDLYDHLDDADLSAFVVGVFRRLLLPLAQGILAKDAKYSMVLESYRKLQDTVETLKREKAKANDVIGDLNKQLEELRDSMKVQVQETESVKDALITPATQKVENGESIGKSELKTELNEPSKKDHVLKYKVDTMNELLDADVSSLKNGDLVEIKEGDVPGLYAVVNDHLLPKLNAYAYIGDETHPSELCDTLIKYLQKEEEKRHKYVDASDKRYLYANDLRIYGQSATGIYRKNHKLPLIKTNVNSDSDPLTVNTKLVARRFGSSPMRRLIHKNRISPEEFKTLIMVLVEDNILSAKILIEFLKTIPFKIYPTCSATTEILDKILKELDVTK